MLILYLEEYCSNFLSQVVPFLLNHLRLNLEQIAACLGRNEDDAAVLLHQIVRRMATTPGLPRDRPDANWASKANRRVWEGEFGRAFVAPEVGRLPETARRLAEAVAGDQSAADAALAAIVNERRADPASAADGGEPLLDNPRFWTPRQRINVASLVHKVGEARLKEACPVLSRFLAEQDVLEQLQYLPDVIRLQSLLIKNFAKTLESSMVRA